MDELFIGINCIIYLFTDSCYRNLYLPSFYYCQNYLGTAIGSTGFIRVSVLRSDTSPRRDWCQTYFEGELNTEVQPVVSTFEGTDFLVTVKH